MTESEGRKIIHLGDITKINGAEIEPVDVITAGSPCQDLSVAGKRAGLDGERSGLFMEQIRIIKEMREHDRAGKGSDEYVRPRYMVWENVPGAFSSNKGEDFRCVLEETAKVAERDAVIPGPPKGKWSKSGAIMGDGWSIAWRVHDAQFWGVPQRRKRIALVADFGGSTAPEILFERKGVSGNITESGEPGKDAAGAVGDGVANTGGAMNPWDSQSARVYPDNGVWHSLNANENGGQSRDSVFCLQGNGIDRTDTAGCNGRGWCEDVSYTLNTIDRPAVMAFAQNQVGEVRVSSMSGTLNTNSNATGRNSPLVYDARGNGDGEIAPTMTGDHQNRVTDYTALCVGNSQLNQMSMKEQANALDTMHDQQAAMIAASLSARDYKDPCAQDLGNNMANYPIQNSVVRRLTPLECERLQGFPDNWTNIGEWTDSKGKTHKDADSPRYKALGNSIALPFWFYLLRRISAQYERPATLGSLFDGIGGFPLCWELCNGKGTARWASEIEEFPIAVTRHWFG